MKQVLNTVRGYAMSERFWLSYWPHSLSLLTQAMAAYVTLAFPYESETLHNVVLLANAIGMTVAIRGAVKCRIFKIARQKQLDEMHAEARKVLEMVGPLLAELYTREFGEEWENVDHQSLMRVQALADAIIEKGFDDLRKSRASQPTPDKT